jgi:hypothetical protein
MSKPGRFFLTSGLAAVGLTVGFLFSAQERTAVAETKKAVVTHLGQPVENLVVLESFVLQSGEIAFTDNPLSVQEYTPPTGAKLVVTDVDWHAGGTAIDDELFFQIFVYPSGRSVFRSSARAGRGNIAFAFAGASVPMTAGFVLNAGETLRGGVGGPGTGIILNLGILRGYLIFP